MAETKSKILLGICGSIAAYRSPDCIKTLKAHGYDLAVCPTESALKFVTRTTLETFSGRFILEPHVFAETHLGTEHIDAARWADQIVIYGATAHFIAKLAAGFTDDFLSLQVSASKAPVYIVPAMNPVMWESAANQANVKTLEERSFSFIGPEWGKVACGETGWGHVSSFDEILKKLASHRVPSNMPQQSNLSLVDHSAWSGKKVLISAGPMRSQMDSVRYLQNASSGKMGFAFATALKEQGAEVSVLLGPVEKSVEEEFLKDFSCYKYKNSMDYDRNLLNLFSQSDVFFSAAAVLDFEFECSEKKLARSELGEQLQLAIQPTPDFVKKVCLEKKDHQKVIAFSLEEGTREACMLRAEKKLAKKGADFILLNRVSSEGVSGPYSDENEMWLIASQKEFFKEPQFFSKDSKRNIAKKVVQSLEKIL